MGRSEGQAVLAGLAALDVPSCDPVVRGKPAHSIAFVHVSGRRVLGRAYDKGREAGTAGAWELIRLEDQFRPASGKRPGREKFHAEYVRGRFHKRFVPLYRSARGVKVTGLPVVAKDVAQRVRAGELDTRRAERMMGSLLLLSAGGPLFALHLLQAPGRAARERLCARRRLLHAGGGGLGGGTGGCARDAAVGFERLGLLAQQAVLPGPVCGNVT